VQEPGAQEKRGGGGAQERGGVRAQWVEGTGEGGGQGKGWGRGPGLPQQVLKALELGEGRGEASCQLGVVGHVPAMGQARGKGRRVGAQQV